MAQRDPALKRRAIVNASQGRRPSFRPEIRRKFASKGELFRYSEIDLDFDFRVTCFRMYNVYGSRQALDNPYQGVLGIFVGNLLRGEPITIFGDGHQSRDFIYIDDVVDAWVGALTNAETYGGVINLGSGRRLSIRQLADHVLSAFNRARNDSTIVFAAGRPGEQRHVEANITLAREILKWEPRVPFEQGLTETIRWAKSVYV